jgi:hypothetical protein
MRELFVKELKEVKGGAKPPRPGCPQITTLACCEESPRCDPCCEFE